MGQCNIGVGVSYVLFIIICSTNWFHYKKKENKLKNGPDIIVLPPKKGI